MLTMIVLVIAVIPVIIVSVSTHLASSCVMMIINNDIVFPRVFVCIYTPILSFGGRAKCVPFHLKVTPTFWDLGWLR